MAVTPVLAGLLLALTPLLALVNLVSDRHTGRREYLVEHKDYLTRLADFRVALAETAVAEERQARVAHPDPGTIVSLACHPSARLWERRRGDADFLTVRVGLVDRPAAFALWPEPTGFAEVYPEPPAPPTVYDVPVTVALPKIRVLGVVCAARDTMLAAARALVAQVATLHAPDDLSIVVATAPDSAPDWAWTTWLPHTVTTPRPGTVTLVVADGVSVDVTGPGDERYAVYFATDEQELPRGCGAVIVADGTRATVRGAGRPAVADVLLDGLVPAAATRVARALAPVRLASENTDVATIQDTVPAIAARSVKVGPRPPVTVPDVRSASSANPGIPPHGEYPQVTKCPGAARDKRADNRTAAAHRADCESADLDRTGNYRTVATNPTPPRQQHQLPCAAAPFLGARAADGSGEVVGRPTDIGVLAGYRFLAEPGVDPHGWLGPLCATAPVVREKDGRHATAHIVLDVTERLLRRRLLADAAAVKTVLARLASPYLSAILDHAVDGSGRPTLFTEPFGPSLAVELADRGPLPVAEVMAAAEAAGAALTALHGAGRLHHVVSPRALLRLPGNRIQLSCPAVPALAEQLAADRDGTGHEPPEVLTSGEWTPVGDVYALASTLWHLLAGTPPTSGTQEERLAKLHAAEQPTLSRPDVPEHVRAALTAALAVDPADRPTDVAELVGLLTGRPSQPLSQYETQPPDQPAHVQGRALGSNYWLEERIGAGGSGVVYRARRVADGTVVAAKLLASSAPRTAWRSPGSSASAPRSASSRTRTW